MDKKEYLLRLLELIMDKNYVEASNLYKNKYTFINKEDHNSLYNVLVQMDKDFHELVDYFYSSIINDNVEEINYCLSEFWSYDYVSSVDMDVLEFLTDSNRILEDKKELHGLNEIKSYIRYQEEEKQGHVIKNVVKEENSELTEKEIRDYVEELFDTIDEIDDSVVVNNLSNYEIKLFKKYLKRKENLKSFIVKTSEDKYLVINKFVWLDKPFKDIAEDARKAYREKRYGDALVEYKKLLCNTKLYVDNYAKIGLCYYHLGNYDKAKVYLKIAIDICEDKYYEKLKTYDFSRILKEIDRKNKKLKKKM